VNLGQLIRQKRKERNLTQTDVAKQIGVATNTVSKYERNIIENMGRDKIVALSKLLDIPTTMFIEAMDNIPSSNIEEVTPQEFVRLLKELLEKTTDLSKEQKEYLLNTIEFICNDKK
jgi:transcriptional regulator with XRE-family HTH domain